MTTLQQARAAIRQFEKLRHPSLGDLRVSELYSLSREEDAGPPADQYWPAEWPFAAESGVYLILDEQKRLLYVGKASMGNELWNRLGAYFGGRATCRIKHEAWSAPPQYVVTVAVPRKSSWEAPALEEYLIAKLRPIDNTRGLRPHGDGT